MDNIHQDDKGEILKDIAFFILQEKANSIIFTEVSNKFIESKILDEFLISFNQNK